MASQLKAKHDEELEKLRREVTLELRESMEAAHQAEMHQAQVHLPIQFKKANILTFTNVLWSSIILYNNDIYI